MVSGAARLLDPSLARPKQLPKMLKRGNAGDPFIPGLTALVYRRGSYHTAGTPTLEHCTVMDDGSVDSKWTALSSDRRSGCLAALLPSSLSDFECIYSELYCASYGVSEIAKMGC